MRIGVLFTGGKDSTLTAFLISSYGFDVELITFIPKNKESYMLHPYSLEVTQYQAKAMGFPIKTFYVSGEKEKEVKEMLNHLSNLKLDGIASGAIASEYQKQRIDWIGERLNIPSYSPLWHKNPIDDFKRMRIIFSSVSAYGLGREHLGKDVLPFLEKYGFFEGGDAETLVLDAPFFKYKLDIEFEIRWEKDRGNIEIKKVNLVKKAGN